MVLYYIRYIPSPRCNPNRYYLYDDHFMLDFMYINDNAFYKTYRQIRIRTFAPSTASFGVHEHILQHKTALLVGALIFSALYKPVLKHES